MKATALLKTSQRAARAARLPMVTAMANTMTNTKANTLNTKQIHHKRTYMLGIKDFSKEGNDIDTKPPPATAWVILDKLDVTITPKGELGTKEFQMHYKMTSNGKDISPWHDIPLQAGNNIFHMVNEIPRGTNAKMEVCA